MRPVDQITSSDIGKTYIVETVEVGWRDKFYLTLKNDGLIEVQARMYRTETGRIDDQSWPIKRSTMLPRIVNTDGQSMAFNIGGNDYVIKIDEIENKDWRSFPDCYIGCVAEERDKLLRNSGPCPYCIDGRRGRYIGGVEVFLPSIFIPSNPGVDKR